VVRTRVGFIGTGEWVRRSSGTTRDTELARPASVADSLADLAWIRAGSVGERCRCTHRHVSQLDTFGARAHLVNMAERTDLRPGIDQQAYLDINSLLGPVLVTPKTSVGEFRQAAVAR